MRASERSTAVMPETRVPLLGEIIKAPGATAAAQGMPPDLPTIIEKIELKFVNPATVWPLVQASGLQIVTSTDNIIIVRGSEEAIKEFRVTVGWLDVPGALLRPVRITVVAKVTSRMAGDTKEREDVAATESLGIERTQIPLTISAEANNPNQRNLELSLNLTPTIMEYNPDTREGKISLTGTGRISGHLPIEFKKDFQVAVSVPIGGDENIASGEVMLGSDTNAVQDNAGVNFYVIVRVSVAEGMIQAPPTSPQTSGYGSYGGMSGGYSSYRGDGMSGGGISYGGGFGSGFRGIAPGVDIDEQAIGIKAREAAQKANCNANLKELAAAAKAFAAKNGGQLPASYKWQSQLKPYLKSKSIPKCPAGAIYAFNNVLGGGILNNISPQANLIMFFEATPGLPNAIGGRSDAIQPHSEEGCFA
ncbi:MAG: hypothetical protein Q7N50_08455, partial [Armatimonadota bacterium]|nr:hypothetical protein [Armatimonadota bacterium]